MTHTDTEPILSQKVAIPSPYRAYTEPIDADTEPIYPETEPISSRKVPMPSGYRSDTEPIDLDTEPTPTLYRSDRSRKRDDAHRY